MDAEQSLDRSSRLWYREFVANYSCLERRNCSMRKMTEANLQAAFAGESQASMRYKIYAEGRP